MSAALVAGKDLGAAPLVDAVQAAARRSRLNLTEGRPDGMRSARGTDVGVPPNASAIGLTSRECDVLRLLVDGATNRQIARALSISERTVGVHVSHVLTKLGVSTRTAAAAASHAQHLLDE